MESPITRTCLELLRAVHHMRADILSAALQLERIRQHQATLGTYFTVEHEPVHVSWTEGRLRLRATCDTRTGEVLALSVQPMPTHGDAEELPALELAVVAERDPAQGVLEV